MNPAPILCVTGGAALAVLCAISLIAFGPAPARAEFDPFDLPRTRFATEVSRIALRPLRSPAEIPIPARLENILTDRILGQLAKAEFETVHPVEFERRWRKYSTLVGGTYDTTTGRVKEDPYAIVNEFTLRDLALERGADAILLPTLFYGRVDPVADGIVLETLGVPLAWQTQSIYLMNYADWPQEVTALFLGIEIRSVDGVRLYRAGCAITWTRIYRARGFSDRRPDRVYEETEFDATVARCLAPLSSLASDLARERNATPDLETGSGVPPLP